MLARSSDTEATTLGNFTWPKRLLLLSASLVTEFKMFKRIADTTSFSDKVPGKRSDLIFAAHNHALALDVAAFTV